MTTKSEKFRKSDWRKFMLPTKKKKERVSANIDRALLITFDEQLKRLGKR